MGVMYTEHLLEHPKCRKQLSHPIVKDINVNSIYRTDEIYKECSYAQLPDKNVSKTTKAQLPYKKSLKKSVKERTRDKNQRWSKVFKSPDITKRSLNSPILKPELIIELNAAKQMVLEELAGPLENNLSKESLEIINVPKNPETEIKRTTSCPAPMTSVISFPIKAKKAFWEKHSLPRFVCPCCTGGGDDIEPYTKNPTESYESINLRTASKVFPLSSSASVLSIQGLPKRLHPRELPKLAAALPVIIDVAVKRVVNVLKFFKA